MAAATGSKTGHTTGPETGPGSVWRGPHGRLTLGLCATTLVIAFEAMAVATAMPVAVRDLHGLRFYSLAFGAFMAASMFATVLSGQWCDRDGPVRPLSAGLGAFGVGLLLAGTARTMWIFTIGRTVQGLGAGLIIVAVYVVVARAFPESLRPRVFAALSSAWVLPSIIGPAASGFVTDHFGWRWVFLALIPVIAAPVALMLPTLRRLRRAHRPEPASDHPAPDPGPRRRLGRLPLALAAAVGMALFQYGGEHVTAASALWLGLAAVLVIPSVPRLLPAGALRGARGLPSVVISRSLLAGAFFGTEAFLPLMLITRRGLTPTLAGLCLTSAALGWCTGSWYQGRPSTAIPRPRLVGTGAALVATGVCGVALSTWSALPPFVAAVGWVVGGLGMGVGMASLSVLVIALSPPEQAGANSASLQVADSLGQLTGTGVGGVVFALGSGGAAAGAGVFGIIFALTFALAALCVVVGPRAALR